MSKYITINPVDIANGLGCRVVIFLSGCPHHCKNCHNPQTWDRNNGIEFTDVTINELRRYLNHDYIQGITISGGDPLYEYNLETTNKIIDLMEDEFPNKDIWIYTGFTFDTICFFKDQYNTAMRANVLVDGEYKEELHSILYPYAGSTNQKVIDLDKMKAVYKDDIPYSKIIRLKDIFLVNFN